MPVVSFSSAMRTLSNPLLSYTDSLAINSGKHKYPLATSEAPMLRWHRPLLFLSAAMAALTLVFLVLVFVDGRTLDGLPIWIKPMKFAISFALYAFVWAWLLSLRHRAGRVSWWMGTALVVAAF